MDKELMEADKELVEKAERTAAARASTDPVSPAGRSATKRTNAGLEKVKEKAHSVFGVIGKKQKVPNNNKPKLSLNKLEVFGSWATSRKRSNIGINLMLFKMTNKKNMSNNFRS